MDRLGVQYQAEAPKFDENSLKGQIKNPLELAQALARGKAESLASDSALVIGGDQLVSLGSEILGKPGTARAAFLQLKKMQGKTHDLITAVCVCNGKEKVEFVDQTKITLRTLTDQEIQSYIERDTPLDCAGSYKIEKSGITLIEKLECSDPSAIQGLPLIQLSAVLRKYGVTT